MKILLLHLSDIHIKDEKAINNFQIGKIADALNAFTFNRIVLLLSGDIAFSGERIQYSIGKVIIGKLINEIKNRCKHTKWINTICVPGNHDIAYGERPISSNELQTIRRDNTYANNIKTELIKQKNYLDFAKKYRPEAKEALFEQCIIDLDGYQVEINLINSAAFSSLEEDKGLHYIQTTDVQKLQTPTHADFVISMMHHSPEWFIDGIKNSLEEAICSKSSIVLYGHEHYLGKKQISFENGREAYIQAGGCLALNGDWSRSSFHIGAFDSDTLEYKHIKLTWNLSQGQYEESEEETIKLANKPSEERVLTLVEEFQDTLLTDKKRELSKDFRDYFVFPRLEPEMQSNASNKDFLQEDAFVEEILSKKKVLITGGYNSGKTTLLKELFLKLFPEYVVVFCGIDDIRGKNTDRILQNSFQEIYGNSPSDYNRFLQTPKSKKVLIIDDIDQIQQKYFESFVEQMNNYFEYFIFASRQFVDLSLFERMKVQLKASDTIYKYKIAPLYADKRQEIISKVVALKAADETEIPRIVKLLCEAITSQKNFMNLDPDFVIKYVEYYCNNLGDINTGDSGVFSKVFEAGIINALSQYTSARLSVDKARLLLSKVAFYIHFNKAYPISELQMLSIIADYNSEYGDSVRGTEFISIIEKAKIVEFDNLRQGYRFVNKNYLAYFTAVEIIRLYNDTGNDTALRSVLHSACFGINGDILLFISFITDNVRVLRLILEIAQRYTEEWPEFDFISNCPVLLKKDCIHEILPPNEETKELAKAAEISAEKKHQEELQTIDIYDYSDENADDLANKIIRAMQLMVIVARCLPNFEHQMKKTDKDAFVRAIYTLPNRIFHLWGEIADQEIGNLVKFFKEQSLDYYNREKPLTDVDIVKALQWAAMSFALDLFNLPVFYAAKEHTMQYLNSFNYKEKETYSLQHLMMLERHSSSRAFTDEAIDMQSKKVSQVYTAMLTRVVSHALVFKDELDFPQRQQIQSKFFLDGGQKHFLVQRMQNASKEE